jgi:hypothetical protein
LREMDARARGEADETHPDAVDHVSDHVEVHRRDVHRPGCPDSEDREHNLRRRI